MIETRSWTSIADEAFQAFAYKNRIENAPILGCTDKW